MRSVAFLMSQNLIRRCPILIRLRSQEFSRNCSHFFFFMPFIENIKSFTSKFNISSIARAIKVQRFEKRLKDSTQVLVKSINSDKSETSCQAHRTGANL